MGCGASAEYEDLVQESGSQIRYSEKSAQAVSKEQPSTRQPDASLGDLRLGVADEKLQLQLDSLGDGELFADKEFAADDAALYYQSNTQAGHADGRVEWKRPLNLHESPYLIIGGAEKNDIQQGMLGDCWFLSSCAVIAQEPAFLNRVIPENQPLSGSAYKGVVQFRFWRFGEWVSVCVDDKLPTRDGQLMYAHSSNPSEFWVSLLEKAYAKLHGSYQAIEGGNTMDALVDLTGGLAERYEFNRSPDPRLFANLHKARLGRSFIACSKKGDWRESNHADNSTGLVSGHAYSITDVKRINTRAGVAELVRVRNPWGNETEWTGRWSDNDAAWADVPEQTKQELQYAAAGDGEFWMSFDDFVSHFSEVTVCNTEPDLDGDGRADTGNHFSTVHGRWVRGKSAGGCRNNMQAFATNPQFHLSLTEPDDDDDDPSTADKCSVVLTLMQEHRRSQREFGVSMLQIGYCIYKSDRPGERVTLEYLMTHREAEKSGVYINLREVSKRFCLSPGHYVVIPSAFNEGDTSTFMIRAFALKPFTLTPLQEF